MATIEGAVEAYAHEPETRRLSVTRDVAVLAGFAAFVLIVVAWSYVPPHSTIAPSGLPFQAPGTRHWAGTDDIGRDIFSRILVGSRLSVFAVVVVLGSGIVVGGIVGLLAGAVGGATDFVLMRITDVFLAMPGPLLVLAVVSALGPTLQHTLIAVAIVWWPFYARIVRGEVKSIMSRSHIEAARMGGAGRFRIAFKHVLPGTWGAILVTASLDIGALMLTLAGLSFLGLGSPPPAP